MERATARPTSLYAALMDAAGWRLGLHVIRVMRHDMGSAGAAPAPAGVSIREVASKELLPHCLDRALDLDPTTAHAGFERGARCVGAFDGPKLVGYVWLAREDTPHIGGIWVRVPPRAVYRYKSWTRRDYRGRGIAAAIYRYAETLYDRGEVEAFLTCMAAQNVASIAASRAAGGVAVGFIAYRQRPGRLSVFHSPGARGTGLRFVYTGQVPAGSTLL